MEVQYFEIDIDLEGGFFVGIGLKYYSFIHSLLRRLEYINFYGEGIQNALLS